MKIVIGSLFILSLSSGLVEELAAATNVYAKIGFEAVLPCEWADDSVRWYGIGDHQYSTGTRILQGLPISLRQRLHIIENNGFNLGIRDIHKDDEGNYKCTSDNGTINYILYLIVAPSSISFPSSSDENVITADANKMFNVTCEADGGFPPPELSVLWNDTLLSSSKTRTLAYAINLTRTYDFTNVTCTANHSELNHPLEIHAMFYLNFPPTQLTMKELPTLFEGKPVNISCISLGSRPQASSEWTIDGDVISNSSEDQSEIMNPTKTYRITSNLSVEFNRLQNRKELSCRSSNLADTKGISQSRMLEIYYPPKIHVTYKNTTEDEELRIFICKPNGNPAVYEYDKWEHFSMHKQFIRQLEGRKTDTGASEVILPVTNLNKRYQDSGIYICRAQNDIADRYGNKIQRGSGSFISEGTPAAASENVYSNKGKLKDDTILIVKVVSIPPPDFYRFTMDDGRDVPINNSKKYTKTITPAIIEDSFHGKIIHVDGYIISLFIRNLEEKDFNKYYCEVHNSHGNISLTVELVQTTENGNVHDGGWQTAGIVLITIVGLVIVITAALCIYKQRKYYYDFSDSRQRRRSDNVELNHQWHDRTSSCHVANKNEEKVSDGNERREIVDNEYIPPENEQQHGRSLSDDVDEDYIDGRYDLADDMYTDPQNEQQHDSIKSFKEVPDPRNRAPLLLPDKRNIDENGHPSKTENDPEDHSYHYTSPNGPPETSLMKKSHEILGDKKQFEVTVSDPTFEIVDVPTETRKIPVIRKTISPSPPTSSQQLPRTSHLQSSSIEDNICMEPLHDPPKLIPRSQIPLPASLLRSLSIEDNIRMEPLQEEPGPLTRSKKPLPSLSSSPSIEEHELMNTPDGISNQTKCLPTRFTTESISSEQPLTINHVIPISRSPPPSPPVEAFLVLEDDVSSGFASFHGPGSMDQRPSIARSIQPLLQDRLEEEDKSSCDDSSNSNSEHEDEATAIDNPSYHEKEETRSSIHSSSNEETTGIEEVQQPTTNTDKKKLLQYYPTFPKKTDDDTWTEPAEPIKVLDEGETQPMELSPSLNDHNDQDKTDSTSEDKSPETEN